MLDTMENMRGEFYGQILGNCVKCLTQSKSRVKELYNIKNLTYKKDLKKICESTPIIEE